MTYSLSPKRLSISDVQDDMEDDVTCDVDMTSLVTIAISGVERGRIFRPLRLRRCGVLLNCNE